MFIMLQTDCTLKVKKQFFHIQKTNETSCFPCNRVNKFSPQVQTVWCDKLTVSIVLTGLTVLKGSFGKMVIF